MIRIDSTSQHPSILFKYIFAARFFVRNWSSVDVEVRDDNHRYRFRCNNLREYTRCVKMFIKEPGTCSWIRSEVKPGHIFYDIGANIGVYTILAASRVRSSGKVYAFEPHSGNFGRLLANIQMNNMANTVFPCNFAINNQAGIFQFEHVSIESGQSNSQLTDSFYKIKNNQYRSFSELKLAVTIDDLIQKYRFDPPHHIKIDVDGNELLILHGMANLLKSRGKPLTVQIEISKTSEPEIFSLMKSFGYGETKTHYTRSKIKKRAKGQDAKYPYNAIFGL